MVSCSGSSEPLPEDQGIYIDPETAKKYISGLDTFRTWPDTIFCHGHSDAEAQGIHYIHPVMASMLKHASQEEFGRALEVLHGIVAHHFLESDYDADSCDPEYDPGPPPSTAELNLMDKMNAVSQGGLFAAVMRSVEKPVSFKLYSV